MKKIAIITLQGMWNYGNRLQNYAVSTVLSKKLDNISYNILESKYVSKPRMILSYLIKKNLSSFRYLKFLNFNKLYSKDIVISNSFNCNFDYVVCGSDQIWNLGNSNNSLFFGSIISKEKRIAYAASFGVSQIPDEYKENYKKKLSEMKAISVREDSGAKIVKELTGRDVPVLIDPTMMLTKDEWCKIEKKPKFCKKNKKYIFTYFLGKVMDEYRSYIEKFAKESNCEVINLEFYKHNKFWYRTGPREFIWLINNCTAMFTDSFHGSVFSILMNVPFIVFDRDGNGAGMGSRIDTLLDKFDLYDRKFSNQNMQQVFKIDYSHIEPILSVERKKSIDFLKDAMEI